MRADSLPLHIHVQAEALCASGWEEAIPQLAATLAQQTGLGSPQAIISSALERELSEPTYLGKGLALPHARIAGLARAGICVAHAPAGIPWHAGKAQLIILLAVPEETPELYLTLMSRLVRWRLRLDDSALTAPTLPAADWQHELRERLLAS